MFGAVLPRSPNLSRKMRRTGLLQLGLLCFVLSSNLTEWRWFEGRVCPTSTPEDDVYPMAMRARLQVLQQIDVPPTVCCGFQSENPAPDFAGVSPVAEI